MDWSVQRELIWRFTGATEAIESAAFADTSNPDLTPVGVERDHFGQQLEDAPFKAMLDSTEGGRRGRIRGGSRESRFARSRNPPATRNPNRSVRSMAKGAFKFCALPR